MLLAIHLYMTSIDNDNKTANDEMGIRIVKTVVNELVKIKRDDIWKAYEVVELHHNEDNYIKKWIKIILASLGKSGGTRSSTTNAQSDSTGNAGRSTQQNHEAEVQTILDELRSTD